jgi:hypothetical protein
MAKIIRFAQYFPHYHPKKQQRTHFIEGFYKSIGVDFGSRGYYAKLKELNKVNLDNGKITEDELFTFWSKLDVNFQLTKKHTIRAKTAKTGDNYKIKQIVSPRTWAGVPYRSPNIILWDEFVILNSKPVNVNKGVYFIGNKKLSKEDIVTVANNDCLLEQDFLDWFNKDVFIGQIINWVEVDYL